MDATADSMLPQNKTDYDGRSLIRGAFIYGANGSGKTTIIDAIARLPEIVYFGYDPELPDEYDDNSNLGMINPHILHRGTPTSFCIVFEYQAVKFSYSISILKGVITEETLFYNPNGRMTKLFSRDEQSFSFCKEYEKEGQKCKDYFRRHRPILSIASKITSIVPVRYAEQYLCDSIFFEFYKDGCGTSIRDSRDVENGTFYDEFAKLLYENPNRKEEFITLLNNAGMDLIDIIIEINPSRPHGFNVDSASSRIKAANPYKMKFHHKNGVVLPVVLESHGTKRFLMMVSTILAVKQREGLLVLDEPESHFHPNLFAALMRFFFDSSEKSQIICATHETILLDLKILRRDQIFFTEIPDDSTDRSTVLYSLSSYKGIRNNDASIRDKYLSGDFGAIPSYQTEKNSSDSPSGRKKPDKRKKWK